MPDPGVTQVRKKEMSIEQVQHWVISLLIFSISAFPTGGLIGVSYAVYNQGRHGAAAGLLVMTGVIGVLAVGAMRVVHKRSVATPLLLLGMLPAAIATYVIFR